MKIVSTCLLINIKLISIISSNMLIQIKSYVEKKRIDML